MQLNGLGGISEEIESLKAKAQEFNRAMILLDRKKPDHASAPEAYAKWKELKDYGERTRASISRITGAADTISNIASSTWYGITHPFGFDPFGLGGLGVIPLIPAAGVAVTSAVIASALAAMTYFITSAYEYATFAEATPEVRAAITKREETTGAAGVAGIFKSVTGLLVVAGIIYVITSRGKNRE